MPKQYALISSNLRVVNKPEAKLPACHLFYTLGDKQLYLDADPAIEAYAYIDTRLTWAYYRVESNTDGGFILVRYYLQNDAQLKRDECSDLRVLPLASLSDDENAQIIDKLKKINEIAEQQAQWMQKYPIISADHSALAEYALNKFLKFFLFSDIASHLNMLKDVCTSENEYIAALQCVLSGAINPDLSLVVSNEVRNFRTLFYPIHIYTSISSYLKRLNTNTETAVEFDGPYYYNILVIQSELKQYGIGQSFTAELPSNLRGLKVKIQPTIDDDLITALFNLYQDNNISDSFLILDKMIQALQGNPNFQLEMITVDAMIVATAEMEKSQDPNFKFSESELFELVKEIGVKKNKCLQSLAAPFLKGVKDIVVSPSGYPMRHLAIVIKKFNTAGSEVTHQEQVRVRNFYAIKVLEKALSHVDYKNIENQTMAMSVIEELSILTEIEKEKIAQKIIEMVEFLKKTSELERNKLKASEKIRDLVASACLDSNITNLSSTYAIIDQCLRAHGVNKFYGHVKSLEIGVCQLNVNELNSLLSSDQAHDLYLGLTKIAASVRILLAGDATQLALVNTFLRRHFAIATINDVTITGTFVVRDNAIQNLKNLTEEDLQYLSNTGIIPAITTILPTKLKEHEIALTQYIMWLGRAGAECCSVDTIERMIDRLNDEKLLENAPDDKARLASEISICKDQLKKSHNKLLIANFISHQLFSTQAAMRVGWTNLMKKKERYFIRCDHVEVLFSINDLKNNSWFENINTNQYLRESIAQCIIQNIPLTEESIGKSLAARISAAESHDDWSLMMACIDAPVSTSLQMQIIEKLFRKLDDDEGEDKHDNDNDERRIEFLKWIPVAKLDEFFSEQEGIRIHFLIDKLEGILSILNTLRKDGFFAQNAAEKISLFNAITIAYHLKKNSKAPEVMLEKILDFLLFKNEDPSLVKYTKLLKTDTRSFAKILPNFINLIDLQHLERAIDHFNNKLEKTDEDNSTIKRLDEIYFHHAVVLFRAQQKIGAPNSSFEKHKKYLSERSFLKLYTLSDATKNDADNLPGGYLSEYLMSIIKYSIALSSIDKFIANNPFSWGESICLSRGNRSDWRDFNEIKNRYLKKRLYAELKRREPACLFIDKNHDEFIKLLVFLPWNNREKLVFILKKYKDIFLWFFDQFYDESFDKLLSGFNRAIPAGSADASNLDHLMTIYFCLYADADNPRIDKLFIPLIISRLDEHLFFKILPKMQQLKIVTAYSISRVFFDEKYNMTKFIQALNQNILHAQFIIDTLEESFYLHIIPKTYTRYDVDYSAAPNRWRIVYELANEPVRKILLQKINHDFCRIYTALRVGESRFFKVDFIAQLDAECGDDLKKRVELIFSKIQNPEQDTRIRNTWDIMLLAPDVHLQEIYYKAFRASAFWAMSYNEQSGTRYFSATTVYYQLRAHTFLSVERQKEATELWSSKLKEAESRPSSRLALIKSAYSQ